MKFTVCVLMYGDYPALAERVLGSLLRYIEQPVWDLRIGCNEVSPRVEKLVRTYAARFQSAGRMHPRNLYVAERNMYKYPMMRQMWYTHEVTTPYVMWFDDDSWILDSADPAWFDLVAQHMQSAEMLGSIWRMKLYGKQPAWVKARPWYTGKPVYAGQHVLFVTGGWWTIRTSILKEWDWPDPDIKHYGGDMMLGQLMRQRGYRVVNFTSGLAINADDTGKCSTAARRSPAGLSHHLVGAK